MTEEQQLAGLRAQLDQSQTENAQATADAAFLGRATTFLAYREIEKAVNDPKRKGSLPTEADARKKVAPQVPAFVAKVSELSKAGGKNTELGLFRKAAEEIEKAPKSSTPTPANVVPLTAEAPKK